MRAPPCDIIRWSRGWVSLTSPVGVKKTKNDFPSDDEFRDRAKGRECFSSNRWFSGIF